ncbi:ATP-binding cassette subfamily C protein CydD [Sinobacterium caligoides]|uniref:ATP-binding cassette subfamily C protein CydD n=1 Tax=Sinobacterium caligoides TaxID=933926 RepID=A0A3N2DQG6_9GAMM|nr:thiol reductant ABC exporter subunit CydD [Sinobacterium caligoides]ROS02043.1 ATP-binding cassette subfamily C protein CydD [Sinobacterium caligoides]
MANVLLVSLQKQQRRYYAAADGAALTIALCVVAQAALLASIISEMVLQRQITSLYIYLLMAVFGLRYLAHWGKDHCGLRASLAIRYPLRRRLLTQLANLGPGRKAIDHDGGLSSIVYEQVDALDDYFSRYISQTRLALLVPLVSIIAAAFVSWLATAVFLLTAPLVIYFMILVGERAARANRQQFQRLALLSNQFVDLSRGLQQLKILRQTERGEARLRSSAEAYQQTTMKVLRLAFISTATLELFASLAIAIIALVLGLGLLQLLPWARGETFLALPQALFLLLLAPEFYQPLRQLGADYHAKQKAQAAAEQIELILQQPLSNAPTSSPVQHASQPPRIRFHDVHWQVGERTLLQGVDLEVSSGETLWLSGHSGAGKTSIINLLLGFEQRYRGDILVDGIELRQVELAHWRRQLAWLPQQPEWVSGTLRQNLLLGCPALPDSEIVAALQQAEAWSFVDALPLRLDASISELGSGLSGGQLQRLSIARAILSNAPLWLLDEPCAHLDTQTAEAILDTLRRVCRDKTTIIVSHDTQPLPWAQQQLSVAQGRIRQLDEEVAP